MFNPLPQTPCTGFSNDSCSPSPSPSPQVRYNSHSPVLSHRHASRSVPNGSSGLNLLVGISQPTSTTSPISPLIPPERTHSMILRPPTYRKTRNPQALVALHSKQYLNFKEHEPSTFNHAIKIRECKTKMSEEIEALRANGTWTLVPKPSHANIVDNKWIFRIKRRHDGWSIEHYKARLVSKEFTEQFSLDYTETFSLVFKATTVRVILGVATKFSWAMKQPDVSNAFLHGYLEEVIYMSHPRGFVDATKPDYVCKLHKLMYGLRQSSRV